MSEQTNKPTPDELTAEMYNVMHETGLTPRQLAEQRGELIAALRGMVFMASELTPATESKPSMIHSRALLAKCGKGEG